MSGDDALAFGTLDIVSQFQVAQRVFVDARLPLTVGSLGNPMLGVRGVARPAERFWITLGGSFGFPLIGDDEDLIAAGSFSQAWWNLHQYAPETVPIMLHSAFEGHVGEVGIFRAEVDPVLYLLLDPERNDDGMELAMQFAGEFQLGHTIGGGLRFQGVWLATSNINDNVQIAMEPFFIMEREHLFLRFGMLLPLTDPLGTPFDPVWGVRAATGIHFD
ncbi:MAG TPA: hypothetical protein VLS89_08335, partial [Candidatus Nanopelagicales bacterium]|nr:hypothetical protein [Candidatus Nanopelagicales bacterium]